MALARARAERGIQKPQGRALRHSRMYLYGGWVGIIKCASRYMAGTVFDIVEYTLHKLPFFAEVEKLTGRSSSGQGSVGFCLSAHTG